MFAKLVDHVINKLRHAAMYGFNVQIHCLCIPARTTVLSEKFQLQDEFTLGHLTPVLMYLSAAAPESGMRRVSPDCFALSLSMRALSLRVLRSALAFSIRSRAAASAASVSFMRLASCWAS